jgi:hypothetical protein
LFFWIASWILHYVVLQTPDNIRWIRSLIAFAGLANLGKHFGPIFGKFEHEWWWQSYVSTYSLGVCSVHCSPSAFYLYEKIYRKFHIKILKITLRYPLRVECESVVDQSKKFFFSCGFSESRRCRIRPTHSSARRAESGYGSFVSAVILKVHLSTDVVLLVCKNNSKVISK